MKKSKILSIVGIILVLAVLIAVILSLTKTEIKDEEIAGSPQDVYIKNGKVSSEKDFTEKDDFIKIQKLDEKYNKLTDYGKGFTIKYKENMDIDASLSNIPSTGMLLSLARPLPSWLSCAGTDRIRTPWADSCHRQVEPGGEEPVFDRGPRGCFEKEYRRPLPETERASGNACGMRSPMG